MTTDATPSLTAADETRLSTAIGIAAEAVAHGEQPYGSLLVDEHGSEIARDHNTVLSSRDITAHPELKLARWAASTLTPQACSMLTMYTSCQPCEMCSTVIARAGLGRVVYALSADQANRLQPADPSPIDNSPAVYQGPALFDEASRPILDHYANR